MKSNLWLVLFSLVAVALSEDGVRGVTITDTASYTVGTTVPDNDLNGLANTQTFTSSIDSVADLTVSLSVRGGFNGDLYAYVTHGSGLVVLLNRVGVTNSDPFGYSDAGFDVTFNDAADKGNIHNYQLALHPGGGSLSGAWQPDGRATSPVTAVDADPVTTRLNLFNGSDPNGEWTLFIADVSPAGTSTLVSWGISVTSARPGTGVSDNGSTALLMLLSSGLLAVLARRALKQPPLERGLACELPPK